MLEVRKRIPTVGNDGWVVIGDFFVKLGSGFRLADNIVEFIQDEEVRLRICIEDSRITYFTDYVNRGIFFLYNEDDIVLSTVYYRIGRLLSTSIYDYLLNGIIHNGKTLWDRSFVAQADMEYYYESSTWKGIKRNSVEFGKGNENLSSDTFYKTLINSVIKSTGETSWVSLSGGMDSAALMYAISKYTNSKVFCLTYSNNFTQESSDGSFAVYRANEAGIPITRFNVGNQSLLKLIELNAEATSCIGKWCDEIEIYQDKKWLNIDSLFVGDTYFLPKVEFRTVDDMFNIVGYKSTYLPNRSLDLLFRNQRKEYLFERKSEMYSVAYRHKNDIRDFVYWRYRLSTTLMWWRFSIQGRYTNIRIPFLSREVFDQFATIPANLRDNERKHYMEAIKKIDKRIFGLGRAKYHAVPTDYKLLFKNEVELILNNIDQTSSLLDEYIPKSTLKKVIVSKNLNLDIHGVIYSLRHRWKWFNLLCGFLGVPVKPSIKNHTLLLRLLTIRKHLEQAKWEY